MNLIEKHIAKLAIEELSNQLSNAGCNDLELEDSKELRELWREYNAWNLSVSLDELNEKDDQYKPYPKPYRGKVTLNGYLFIFVLKKKCGLLGWQ